MLDVYSSLLLIPQGLGNAETNSVLEVEPTSTSYERSWRHKRTTSEETRGRLDLADLQALMQKVDVKYNLAVLCISRLLCSVKISFL
jgi:hypothetical protein